MVCSAGLLYRAAWRRSSTAVLTAAPARITSAEDRGQNVIKCLSLTIYLPVPSQLRFPIGKFMHNSEINPVREGLGSSLKKK